jgi:natural product precursor
LEQGFAAHGAAEREGQMKKLKKIAFERETLRHLERQELEPAKGGLTVLHCNPTYWCSNPRTCSYTSC